MRTLFLAWQATQGLPGGVSPSRGWFPVGRLEASPEKHYYRFMYTKGAESAQKAAGFGFLDALPKLDKVYESSELFPLFQNRVLNPRRGDYAEYVERLALDPKHVDPLDILEMSEGRRQTDNLRSSYRSSCAGMAVLCAVFFCTAGRVRPGSARQIACDARRRLV